MSENSRRLPTRTAQRSAARKPRLLFVGEGKSDVGTEGGAQGRVLAGLIHAALVGPGDPVPRERLPFEIADTIYWKNLVLQPKGHRRKFSELSGLDPDSDRTRAALTLCTLKSLDGVAILRDCERRGNHRLGQQIRVARDGLDASIIPAPLLIVAAPSRCQETWLLADEDAAQASWSIDAAYRFSTSPEDRPHCDELKKHLVWVAEQLHISVPEVREILAFRARPDRLKVTCRRCYPDFFDDVDRELRQRCGM